MDEHELTRILSDLDPGIVLVYWGPAAGCPHCAEPVTLALPEAA